MSNIYSLRMRTLPAARCRQSGVQPLVLSPPCTAQPQVYASEVKASKYGPRSPLKRLNPASSSKRELLLSIAAGFNAVSTVVAAAAAAEEVPNIQQMEVDAYNAYANRDFKKAVDSLTGILQADPQNPRWLEMRAEVLVDGKNFTAAVSDFDAALQLVPPDDPVSKARLLAGRALAYEGLSKWREALADYDQALAFAQAGGESPDPYVINSRGNCYNSLGEWANARENYLVSSQLFQQAKGFRGRGGGTTQRLDGAIYAASNAALMLAQLGDELGALKEFEKISRRAPGSSDTRAALAALYWRNGQPQRAEDVWEFACDNIAVGCSKYQDAQWLKVVRRWPPVMISHLQDFLALRTPPGSRLSSSSSSSSNASFG